MGFNPLEYTKCVKCGKVIQKGIWGRGYCDKCNIKEFGKESLKIYKGDTMKARIKRAKEWGYL